jgi:hypothetical protein
MTPMYSDDKPSKYILTARQLRAQLTASFLCMPLQAFYFMHVVVRLLLVHPDLVKVKEYKQYSCPVCFCMCSAIDQIILRNRIGSGVRIAAEPPLHDWVPVATEFDSRCANI